MKKILVTGKPRSGKSTLLQSVVAEYNNKQGFITKEFRENNERAGFSVVTARGDEQILASIHVVSPQKVSRYGVDSDSFELLIQVEISPNCSRNPANYKYL